jgi:exopolysaccharide biosynthesis protein
VGSFRNKFADKFTDGEVIETDNSYRSANLNITFQKKYFDELMSRVYYADIYIADISCLKTALAEDTFGRGYKEWITKVARRTGSVVTMNGDYYGSRDFGVVARNGILYRDAKNIRDVAVLYWDGSFETLTPEQFNAKQAMAEGAYQIWHFGPRLLDDSGHAMTKFNADSHMVKRHPRSAFGYYEPGHYCFVVVDGRLDTSKGVKLDGLSMVMEGLGCTAAYNLDGGQTSLLARQDTLVNRPSGGGRSASDFIIVVDKVS